MATTPWPKIPRLSYLSTLLLLPVLQFPPPVLASLEVVLTNYSGITFYPSGGAEYGFFYQACSTSSDGWSATYLRNLEQLFGSLVDSVNSTGFSTKSGGEAPDTVYGLSLCRGDLPADRCRSCTSLAADWVKNECPNNRSAMIWMGTSCFLHFSDTRFFGSVNPRWLAWVAPVNSTVSATAAVEAFAFAYTLVRETAGNSKMYATKVQPQKGYTSYGMAQCTRDLTEETCNKCLAEAMDRLKEIKRDLGRPWRFLCSSCHIRYDTEPFFPTSSAPAPAPALAPAPPSSLPSVSKPPPAVEAPPGSRSGNRRKTAIIIGFTLGVLLLATVIFILFFRRRKRKELNEELRRYSNEMASLANLTVDERNYDVPQYRLKAVQVATNNFSDDNKLGRGGFGPVYKTHRSVNY